MTDRPPPQDAPHPEPTQPRMEPPTERSQGPTASWTTWRPAGPQAPHAATPPSQPTQPVQPFRAGPPGAAPAPLPSPEAPRRPDVTYLPPPSGPNWGLVVLGLLFVLVAGGVVANQLTGFQMAQLTEVGPSVLVVGGLVCAAVGAVGILARRR